VLAVAPALAQAEEKLTEQPPQREKFDPTRDPVKDLASAVALASKSDHRILLDVGGEWCPWCRKLDKFFEDNKDVGEFLQKNFIVVKINFSQENQNEKFLSQFLAKHTSQRQCMHLRKRFKKTRQRRESP
jgi:thioredoxin-related protein